MGYFIVSSTVNRYAPNSTASKCIRQAKKKKATIKELDQSIIMPQKLLPQISQ